ncbi:hypothetical protein EUGRSUZ_J03027 [Eucalyptus grandis]|uniref:Uncharacterized protein n=2 Tax=Eucalyptus grandis TaxID=71139 RepID=A0ACC3JAD7_EUCGR|nr:hypothetical protein EUGRSUZ_J03027 [Eucalyptus grandis]
MLYAEIELSLSLSLCGSKTMHSYTEKLSELDQMIRRMILESLGTTSRRLRVMKYAAPRTTDDQIGLAPHTDKIFLTILCQNDVHGLQVQTKHGEWFSARPSPNSFTVMIGDSLYAWVNGSLHSLCHQVMISGNEVRYSAALFSIPKGGYIIKAPNELVDEEHPLLFQAL